MTYVNKINNAPVTAENIHKLFRYDPDTGVLYRTLISGREKEAGTQKGPGMALITQIDKRIYPVTHIIWLLVFGRLPADGNHIDHKNLNAQDNRLCNLREATPSQNAANKEVHTRSRSGIKGVVWDAARSKWAAYIGFEKKTYNLGRYDTVEEAAAAYEAKAKELYGEFARV